MALIQLTCWNIVLPIWRIEVAIWYWWIQGRLEVFFCSMVSILLSVFLIPSFCLQSTNSFYLCPFVSGARGLQSPSLSGFLSFPTSLSRPLGPIRFCCKQSVTAGPTVSITARQHRSAKTCSMRSTNLQVNNTLHHTLPLAGDDCIPLMWLVFLKREYPENIR